jgi:magnesium transporter
VEWHDIRNPSDEELDRLGQQYHLHPLHIEDCRHRNQRAKVEEGEGYLFVVLKPVNANAENDLAIVDLDIFLGHDYLITVQETECQVLSKRFDKLKSGHEKKPLRADQLLYRIMDELVDTYLPILDSLNDEIDHIEEDVLERPKPNVLQRIFTIKRMLIELRQMLGNTRDVAGHLQRTESDYIQPEMVPFLRDVYDHLARNLDLIEMQRDLLTGSIDIYLSSVANRTNQVMKVLTVLGTIALPAIVISGFFGMNMKDLPFLNAPHGTWVALGLMVGTTCGLLYLLKLFDSL